MRHSAQISQSMGPDDQEEEDVVGLVSATTSTLSLDQEVVGGARSMKRELLGINEQEIWLTKTEIPDGIFTTRSPIDQKSKHSF